MSNIQKSHVVLVVSFGTSYNKSRERAIDAIEGKIAEECPESEIRRAFTSRMIINKLRVQYGIEVDSVEQAMDKLVSEGISEVTVQPTHIINGIENEEMTEIVRSYEGKFKSLKIGKPLLSADKDFRETVNYLSDYVKDIGSVETAVVFMGHGTEHKINSVYTVLEEKFRYAGFENVFVGTVEAKPNLKEVVLKVKTKGYKRAVLLPFMIVAGDHAYNDMAGDGETSWKNVFIKEGIEVECIMKGLGEYPEIQNIFAEHAKSAE